MEKIPSLGKERSESLESHANFERVAQKIFEGKNNTLTKEEMAIYKANPQEIERRVAQKKDSDRNVRGKTDTKANIDQSGKKIFRAAVIETTKLMQAQARDVGDAKMTESKEDRNAPWWKKTLTRIWKHNLAQEYYRQKEISKAKGEILEKQNLYIGEPDSSTVSGQQHKEAMDAIVERFTSEYEDEMLKNEEKNSKVEASDVINNAVKDLIKEYASDSSMTKEAFNEERTRILSSFDSTYGEKGRMHTDNLLSIATEIRDAIAHGAKMEEMDFEINLTKGVARESLRTEAKLNTFDRVTEKMQNSKVGRILLNEPTVVAVCAGAYALGTKLSQKFLRSGAMKLASFGGTALLAGGLAAAKESARLERERAQHIRESAKGMVFKENDMFRRQQMEKNRYETRGAREIISNLEENLREVQLGTATRESMQEIIANLADIESRIQLGNQKKIDLVSYSHFSQVEKERTAIDHLRAKLKVALRKGNAEKIVGWDNTHSFDEYLQSQIAVENEQLTSGEAGVEAKDKIFKAMKRKRVAMKFITTTLIGAGIGMAVQEATAFVNPERDGILEGVFKSLRDKLPGGSVKHFINDKMGIGGFDKQTTMLEALRRHFSGEHARLPFGEGCETTIGNTQINLPSGCDIVDNHDGTFDILRDGEIISNDVLLTTNPDGSLTEASVALLAKDDIYADFAKVGSTVSEHCTVTPEEYLRNHPGGTHDVHRDLWYDNDTPKPVFDKNELKLWWGGQGGTGMDADGNFQFNVKHMMPDGSYHDQFNVDAQDKIKANGLKMLFSLTKGTQTHVFEVPIDEHGNALISKDSEIAKLMFENQNGHAVFTGQYAEVAQAMNVEQGVEHVRILATHVGAGREGVDDIIETNKPIPTLKLDLPDKDDWNPPLFVPIVGRRPLERGKYEKYVEPPAIPSKKNIERGAYMGYGEKRKENYTDLTLYRNSNKQIEGLLKDISSSPKLNKQYGFIVKNIESLKNYKQATPALKQSFLKEAYLYNRRYSLDKPISIDEFVSIKLRRLYSQVENIFIENGKVGDKPFSKEFYEKSPLIKGLESCEEIVVILDDPIGDAVLTLPLIISINKYLEKNGIKKDIKVVSRTTPALYKYLEEQFSNVKVTSSVEEAGREKKGRFIFNTNKIIDSYQELGLPEASINDPSKVMSVDWASWQKEESPIDAHHMTKYDPMPARIARAFEIMTGQKLFDDIKNTEKYIEKTKNFDTESKELKEKFNIKGEEKIITISAGSSVTAKEYSPDKWQELIKGIFEKYPNAHILFLDDPDPTKKERYSNMIDRLVSEKGYNISRLNEKLDKMNTILSMSDTVVTPDTGLGHYAAALGTKSVMIYLSDPVLWSAPGVKRVIHGKGYETYIKGVGSYARAWDQGRRNDYYVEDNGVMVGASDITPEQILKKMEEPLTFTKTRGLSSLEKKAKKSPEEVKDDLVSPIAKNLKDKKPATPASKKLTSTPTLKPTPEPKPPKKGRRTAYQIHMDEQIAIRKAQKGTE